MEAKYAGLNTVEKFNQVSEKLGSDIDCILVAALDEIAWFLNLRGTDIEFNPVFFAYMIFYPATKTVDLFTDISRFSEAVLSQLTSVTIKPYDSIN